MVDRFTASCKSGAVEHLLVHMTRRAALLRRVTTKQLGNTRRLGPRGFVTIGAFESSVLRIHEFVLHEIKNRPRYSPEEYFLSSGVSLHRLGSENSVRKVFLT